MIGQIWRRRRVVDGRVIDEPSLLSLGLTAAGGLALLSLLAAVVFFTASFALSWGLFALVAGLLAGLVFWPRLRRKPENTPVTPRQRWHRRLRRVGARSFVFGLAAWLGLIAWAQLSPGGGLPEPLTAPGGVRVVTWNILRGQESGPPWEQNNWGRRKRALGEVILEVRPDILLVQEARSDQLAFLDEILPEHRRVGVGRDDGKSGGEHCAIYFKSDRFAQVGGGTFWLEDPIDEPPGPGLHVKRICTWVRLHDQASGRTLRLYNTHQYLSATAQAPAARIILEHVKMGDPSDAIVLGGDFNAPPEAPSRRLFTDAGLRETATDAGKSAAGTYQFCGVRLRCLDGILVGPVWRVHQYATLSAKSRGLFPSDHFGVLADLTLEQ